MNTMTFGDILITTVKPPVIIVVNDTKGSGQNFKQFLTSDSYGVPKANLVSGGSYKAPKDTYKAPIEGYNAPDDAYKAPNDAYKAPKDTYKAPVDSYKAPDDAYKSPDASYNVIEDDLKAPGKHAAKMPSASAGKPLPFRKPVKASTSNNCLVSQSYNNDQRLDVFWLQNIPLFDYSFDGLLGGANSMMRAISNMVLPAGPLRLKHPLPKVTISNLPKLPPLSSFTPPIHLAARRPRTLDVEEDGGGSSKEDSNRGESSTRGAHAHHASRES